MGCHACGNVNITITDTVIITCAKAQCDIETGMHKGCGLFHWESCSRCGFRQSRREYSIPAGRLEKGLLPYSPEKAGIRTFRVWQVDCRTRKALGEAIVKIEENSWSWGSCKSSTCNHVSHDPYCEGDTVYVRCLPFIADKKGQERFITPQGVIFSALYEGNGHLAPTAKIWWVHEGVLF